MGRNKQICKFIKSFNHFFVQKKNYKTDFLVTKNHLFLWNNCKKIHNKIITENKLKFLKVSKSAKKQTFLGTSSYSFLALFVIFR